jgi:membrane-bound metal-dependent hydrolase YbcI (DUF457 family)
MTFASLCGNWRSLPPCSRPLVVEKHMPSPLGHALAGLAAAWSADLMPGTRAWRTTAPGNPAPPAASSLFDRAGGALTLVCVGLAVAPDLDLLFDAHRSVTHSLSAVAAITIIAAGVTGWVTPRPVWRVALMCGGAYATHLLLDWLATDTSVPYGIRVFWPFNDGWYLSGVNVFPGTERRRVFSLRTMRINLLAMAWETATLFPLVAALWLVRVKALAGLAPEIPRRNHTAQ